MQDWLYDEGDDATKAAYVSKIEELRSVAGPIIQRYQDKLEEERQELQRKAEEEAAKQRAEEEKRKAEEEEKRKAEEERKAEGVGKEGGEDTEMKEAGEPEVDEA